MGSAAPGPWRWADERGFTLIETVAIMAITGLLLAVVLPALPRAVSGPGIEAVAVRAAAILTEDHRMAMRRHVTTSTVVDAGRRQIASAAGARSIDIPSTVAVTTALARTCLGAPAANRIVFLPDGTSCGGTLTLARAGERLDVRVNWLTGATEIVSPAPH